MAVDIDLDVVAVRTAAELAAELATVYAQMASVVYDEAAGGVLNSDVARQLLSLRNRVERIEIEITTVRAACLIAA